MKWNMLFDLKPSGDYCFWNNLAKAAVIKFESRQEKGTEHFEMKQP